MEDQQLAGDLQFIRSMVERTQRRSDPGAPILLTWGIICLFGFPFSEWLAANGRADQIGWLWLILNLFVGAPLSFVFGHRMRKRFQARGVCSYISRQIGRVWWVLLPNGLLWSALAALRDPNLIFFVWACVYGIGLSMMGILYSREWFFAGLAVFLAVPAAAWMLPHSATILGVVMGLGCIVPASIALRRQRQWESADARA